MIAQLVDVVFAHTHAAAGGADGAGLGEQLDELALPLGAPPAAAHALARDGGEAGQGGERVGIGHAGFPWCERAGGYGPAQAW